MQIERNERTFDRDVANSGVSAEAANWLKIALDPFHDSDIRPAGYPDISSSATIVQLVKKQITLGAVDGTTGNWDCNIALLPNLAGSVANIYDIIQGVVQLPSTPMTPATPLSGLVVNQVGQGLSTFSDLGLTTAINPREYVSGACRVVAMGFEVVNSTAEMFKQGQVSVYRQPTYASVQRNVFGVTEPANQFFTDYTMLQGPPSNLADAQLLFGTRSWEAAEGCYVVSRMNNTSNPLKQATSYPVGYSNGSVYGSVALDSTLTVAGSLNANIDVDTMEYLAPFDISGAYFTGLSAQTTLTITIRWYIERAPGPNEIDLVLLAQPSTCYDSDAIEAYSRALCHLPPGVKQGENDAGDWFARVTGAISKFAPKIGKAISTIPGLGFAEYVGDGIGALASLNKKKEKKKEKETSNPQPKLIGSASNLGAQRMTTRALRRRLKA